MNLFVFFSIDSRQKILDTMIEQRQNLELLYINDTIEEQNRIIHQINDSSNHLYDSKIQITKTNIGKYIIYK